MCNIFGSLPKRSRIYPHFFQKHQRFASKEPLFQKTFYLCGMIRTWKSRVILLCIFFGVLSGKTWGQESYTVMCYNLLNYPGGQISNRADTLRTVINYVQPDLLLVQELVNGVGLASIQSLAFADLPDTYATSTFFPNQSLPINQLQQAIVYNTRTFGLADEWIQTTHLRDINICKLYFNEDALASGGDTTFLYVFNTHMKASSGFDNEQERLDMAEDFVAALEEIPSDSYVLFGGDFNLYYSNEPAYQLLLNPNNPIRMEDPIDAPGNWGSSSYPFRHVHTQSTRASQVFGDGAGGGVDDRFDFILVSSNLKDPSSPVRYTVGSYEALGNTGNCYNQNITDCDGSNNDVPYNVLSAMYHFSDHLPVVMELETDFSLSLPGEVRQDLPNSLLYAYDGVLYMRHLEHPANFELCVFDLNGRMQDRFQMRSGERRALGHLAKGLYLFTLQPLDRDSHFKTQKLFWGAE